MKVLGSLKSRILQEFSKGLSAQKIAHGITVGVYLGLFPMLGTTTLLCLAAARVFKLNHLIVQSVNQLVYPLQLALLIPLIELGRAVLGKEPMLMTMADFDISASGSIFQFLLQTASQQFYAVFIWALAVIFTSPIFYYGTVYFLTRFKPAYSKAKVS